MQSAANTLGSPTRTLPRNWSRWGIVLLAASILGLALVAPFTDHAVAFYVLLLSAFCGLTITIRGRPPLRLPLVLGFALLLRVVVLFAPADLSDDLFRYVWDGRVVLAGHNPYLTTPDHPSLVSLRDSMWESTAHRDVPTVYPPLAQFFFAAAALSPRPDITFKVIVLLFDLMGCAALWGCAMAAGKPPLRTLWYAWNPLVVLEGAAMGHVDLLAVPFLIVAILLLVGKRQRLSVGVAAGAAIAAGILIKLVPLVAIPSGILLARNFRVRIGLLVGLFGLSLVGVLALWTTGFPPGLVRYGVSWEFNGPLFEPLWRTLDSLAVDHKAKQLVPLAARLFALDDQNIYSFLYPQFLAKVLLGLLFLGVLGHAVLRLPALLSLHRALTAALLCTATLYPWYLTWALPTAALLERRAWLVLSASIQFAYLPRLFGVDYMPWTYLAVWLPFIVALAWQWSSDRSATRNPGQISLRSGEGQA